MTRPHRSPVRRLAGALLLGGCLAWGASTAAGAAAHHAAHHAAHAPAPSPPVLVWAPTDEPAPIAELDVPFTDQAGEAGILADLVDQPALVTFFYTRCQNRKKCPLTVSRLAGLQRRLQDAGLAGRVRLLAITYEPRFDTPARLERYATNRGLELGSQARALRIDPERQQELIDSLHVSVNYNAGWVNGHGVELNLLDAGGRLVKKYHALFWDNPQVVDDVRRLLATDSREPPP